MECISKEIRPLVVTPLKKELEKAENLVGTIPTLKPRIEKLTETIEAIEALPDCDGKGGKKKGKKKRQRTPYGQHLSDCFAEHKEDWLRKNPDGKMTWAEIQEYMKLCRESWKSKGA